PRGGRGGRPHRAAVRQRQARGRRRPPRDPRRARRPAVPRGRDCHHAAGAGRLPRAPRRRRLRAGRRRRGARSPQPQPGRGSAGPTHARRRALDPASPRGAARRFAGERVRVPGRAVRWIYVLSIRQLTGKWRLLILLVHAAVPPLVGLLSTAGSTRPSPSHLDKALLDGLDASAVLPIIVLGVATASSGNELDDKTLGNLTLTPLPRSRIVLAKLAAALTVALPPLVAGTVGGVLVAFARAGFDGAGRAALAAGVGVAIGALLYSAVFLWAGLVTSHPLALL